MLKIGDTAPDFDLKDQNGNQVKLSNLRGKYVVLYFYPKDLTPGCTIEACSFRDHQEEIKSSQAVVIGIGEGDEKAKREFSEKHELNFPLLFDDDHAIAKMYGAYGEKSMIGMKYMGVSRITYLISPEGKIAYIWEKVQPLGHAKVVIDKINEIRS